MSDKTNAVPAVTTQAVLIPNGLLEKSFTPCQWTSELLVPVLNRPLIFWTLEWLAHHGIEEVLVVAKHMPFELRRVLGEGERWGLKIKILSQPGYQDLHTCLSALEDKLHQQFLCVPTDQVLQGDLGAMLGKRLQEHEALLSKSGGENKQDQKIKWPHLENQLCVLTKECVCFYCEALRVSFVDGVEPSLPMRNAEQLLATNKKLLSSDWVARVGYPLGKGVWVGPHSKIHPSVELKPPVLIGKHCNIRPGATLGPGTIVGHQSIVDMEGIVQQSLLFQGTYVGSHTEVSESVVYKKYLMNIARGVESYVADDHILADANRAPHVGARSRVLNWLLAAVLVVLFSPLFVLLFSYHFTFGRRKFLIKQERFGRHVPEPLSGVLVPQRFDLYSFDSKNAFIHKLPGLFNVLKGEMAFVGNSPLSDLQENAVKESWHNPEFLEAPTGLFHLWEIEAPESISFEEQMVMENYYSVQRGFLLDIKIFVKSFLKSFVTYAKA